MTNPDYTVVEEEWSVVEVAYPNIKFSCWKKWHVDKEYILSTSTEPYVGKVVKEDASGVLLIDAHHAWQETGYRVEGSHVTYLSKAIFQWHLSKPERP